jgi:hypothetical protein
MTETVIYLFLGRSNHIKPAVFCRKVSFLVGSLQLAQYYPGILWAAVLNGIIPESTIDPR